MDFRISQLEVRVPAAFGSFAGMLNTLERLTGCFKMLLPLLLPLTWKPQFSATFRFHKGYAR